MKLIKEIIDKYMKDVNDEPCVAYCVIDIDALVAEIITEIEKMMNTDKLHSGKLLYDTCLISLDDWLQFKKLNGVIK